MRHLQQGMCQRPGIQLPRSPRARAGSNATRRGPGRAPSEQRRARVLLTSDTPRGATALSCKSLPASEHRV